MLSHRDLFRKGMQVLAVICINFAVTLVVRRRPPAQPNGFSGAKGKETRFWLVLLLEAHRRIDRFPVRNLPRLVMTFARRESPTISCPLKAVAVERSGGSQRGSGGCRSAAETAAKSPLRRRPKAMKLGW